MMSDEGTVVRPRNWLLNLTDVMILAGRITGGRNLDNDLISTLNIETVKEPLENPTWGLTGAFNPGTNSLDPPLWKKAEGHIGRILESSRVGSEFRMWMFLLIPGPTRVVGESGISSGERRSALARIGEAGMDLEPPSRGPLSFVSTSLQEVAIQYDAPPEQDYISPHQTSSPALGLLPRIPATQRLGSGSGPITINFEGTSSSPLPDHVMPSKAAGKRKPSKLVGKKKLVRSSPLQSWSKYYKENLW
ncbi:hypothetical protein Bca4012_064065 [Brassica carinata]